MILVYETRVMTNCLLFLRLILGAGGEGAMTIGMISEGGSGDVHTLARSTTIVVSTQSLFFCDFCSLW